MAGSTAKVAAQPEGQTDEEVIEFVRALLTELEILASKTQIKSPEDLEERFAALEGFLSRNFRQKRSAS